MNCVCNFCDMSLFGSLMLCSSNIICFQKETSEMEKSEERTPPRLVEMISERYNGNPSEAFEIIMKVKEKNGGVLKGLKLRKFFHFVKSIITDKNSKTQQEIKARKQKWRKTCHFCYRQFFDNQARNRHLDNVHGDVSDLSIEAEIEVDAAPYNIVEEAFEIRTVVAIFIDEILSDVVKKAKLNSKQKCPECRMVFSNPISLKRHLKGHEKEVKYFQCDDFNDCEFKTLRKDNWWRHRRRIHKHLNINFDTLRDAGKSSNLCKMCGQDFKGDSDLFETHIISKACRNTQANVNDDGRHQCDLCPSSYTNKSSFFQAHRLETYATSNLQM